MRQSFNLTQPAAQGLHPVSRAVIEVTRVPTATAERTPNKNAQSNTKINRLKTVEMFDNGNNPKETGRNDSTHRGSLSSERAAAAIAEGKNVPRASWKQNRVLKNNPKSKQVQKEKAKR